MLVPFLITNRKQFNDQLCNYNKFVLFENATESLLSTKCFQLTHVLVRVVENTLSSPVLGPSRMIDEKTLMAKIRTCGTNITVKDILNDSSDTYT